MSKLPESHYNSNKLNKIFAIASIVLLLAIGGLIMKDYDRKWKDYQKQFRVIEVEKSRSKYEIAKQELNNNPQYIALVKQIEEEENKYEQNCAELTDIKTKITELENKNTFLNQDFQSNKTQLDVVKFNYEEALGHHKGDEEALKKQYLELSETVANLKIEIDDTKQAILKETSIIDDCGLELTKLNRQKRELSAQTSILERKLSTIDPSERSFVNQMADMIRDFPILDLSTPNEKIKQLVIKDITDDLIFTQQPKVERCTTCHLGITNPSYSDTGQPFQSHPRLDLFLNPNSAHPIEEFGCTVCHGGRGRGTSFTSAVHTPSTQEQKEEWEEKYDWKAFHHWGEPMLPEPFFEAGCFKCHSDTGVVKGAETLSLGLNIIEKAGCYNCHEIEKYKNWPKSGPSLQNISSKLTKEFAFKWIMNPSSFKKDTWMPHYFGQSNNDDPKSLTRSEQEVHAITHFLFQQSNSIKLEKVPFKGDPKNGEVLVNSIGCMACHKTKDNPEGLETTRTELHKEFGPILTGLGSKVTQEWLYNWIKDPTSYHPETRMPSLRVTDQEAADMASYLVKNTNDSFNNKQIPSIKENVLNEIVQDFLVRTQTHTQAQAKLKAMPLDEKLIFAGEKLIGMYGCYSCHDIKGFEDTKPIGIKLTYEGDKPLGKFDFGFVHGEHSKWGWFSEKLKDPRVYDRGKVRKPLEKLVMPNFNLNQREVQAVVTALLGFVDDKTVLKKKPVSTSETKFINKGQDLVRQFNCQSCHNIEGEGAVVQDTVEDWLVNYVGKSDSDAEKFKESFSPPNLYGVGKKLNPEWLFKFLHEPQTVRPWLKMRMPTYAFNTSHLNMIVKYFNYLDEEEFPFYDQIDTSLSKEQYTAAEKLFSTEYLDCTKCHVVGNTMPKGTQDTWAPNLALAKTRLKPEWIIEWLKNPSGVVPGTKMPTFWDPSDYENSGAPDILDGNEDEQIRILRNYLMNLSDNNQNSDVKKIEQVTTTPTETPEL